MTADPILPTFASVWSHSNSFVINGVIAVLNCSHRWSNCQDGTHKDSLTAQISLSKFWYTELWNKRNIKTNSNGKICNHELLKAILRKTHYKALLVLRSAVQRFLFPICKSGYFPCKQYSFLIANFFIVPPVLHQQLTFMILLKTSLPIHMWVYYKFVPDRLFRSLRAK